MTSRAFLFVRRSRGVSGPNLQTRSRGDRWTTTGARRSLRRRIEDPLPQRFSESRRRVPRVPGSALQDVRRPAQDRGVDPDVVTLPALDAACSLSGAETVCKVVDARHVVPPVVGGVVVEEVRGPWAGAAGAEGGAPRAGPADTGARRTTAVRREPNPGYSTSGGAQRRRR